MCSVKTCFSGSRELVVSLRAALGKSPKGQARAVPWFACCVSAFAVAERWQSSVDELAHTREPQSGAQSGAINIASGMTVAMAWRCRLAIRRMIMTISTLRRDILGVNPLALTDVALFKAQG